jgi:hypothetical protein
LPEAIVLSARFDYISWIHTGFLALDKPFVVVPSSFYNNKFRSNSIWFYFSSDSLTIAKLVALCN